MCTLRHFYAINTVCRVLLCFHNWVTLPSVHIQRDSVEQYLCSAGGWFRYKLILYYFYIQIV
jgi:hypothetical protein